MTRDEIQRAALALSPEERRKLAELLWESLEGDPEPLPAWQRRLLDERVAALDEHPAPGAAWDEVERRVWADGVDRAQDLGQLRGIAGRWEDGDELADEVERVVRARGAVRELEELDSDR